MVTADCWGQTLLQDVSLHHASVVLRISLQFPGWLSATRCPRALRPSVPGSVSAGMKRFLEGGFSLYRPTCSLSDGKTIWASGCWSEKPSPAVSRLCSGPGSNAVACALRWGQMETETTAKDHMSSLEWVEKTSELAAPKKTTPTCLGPE